MKLKIRIKLSLFGINFNLFFPILILNYTLIKRQQSTYILANLFFFPIFQMN